jgi:signal transduction histidine kinase
MPFDRPETGVARPPRSPAGLRRSTGTGVGQATRRDLRGQRLEAIGRLVAGVAHDFNNLLTVHAGNTELLLENESLDPGSRELVQEIRDVSRRAAGLTRRLTTVGAQQSGAVTPFDLGQVLHTVQPLLRRALPPDIALDFTRCATPLPVRGDPALLELGLMTLSIALRDAMRDGGTLTFAPSLRYVTNESTPECPEMDAGDYAVLAVTDTGARLAADPAAVDLTFLTNAARLSGGCLMAERTPEAGTVTLYLPRLRDGEGA